jgi:serine/threonine protein kinase
MVRELIVIGQTAPPYRHPLTEDLITIGRSSTSTICFPDEMSLSRQHTLIQRRDEGWIVADLGSKNGTLLNGARIEGQVPLSEGDRIEIGDVTVICIGDEERSWPANEIPAAVPEPPSPAGGRIAIVFPGRNGRVTITDPTPFAYGRASALFRTSASDGEEICIKLFPQVQGDQWDNVAAFEREVLAQSNLKHLHILPVLDYGLRSQPHGSPFVVLPYCAGGSLRALIRDRAFYPLPAVLPLLEQIAEALDFAHASGFIHGDVKPENILLSSDRKQSYLSDFGMSNVFAVQERFSTVTPGPQGGTTAYFSPEQISENQQTPSSDIYAFAVTAYELLTGRLPFDQNLPTFRQMTAKVRGEIIDPLRFNPRMSSATKTALLSGLHLDPLKRPRSASELCRLLARQSVTSIFHGPDAVEQPCSVFVSYSHKDAKWLERIRVHLRPLERQGLVGLWDDTRIRPGTNWRDEIAQALETACSAVLLVSANFLASDFCTEEELSQLFRRARDRGVRILPVIISPCQLAASPGLAALQAINAPSRTPVEMDRGEQERVLVGLAAAVYEAVSRRADA